MTNKTLTLHIVTQEKELLKTEAESVTVPTQAGEITILPHHTPLLTSLNQGVLSYQYNHKTYYVAIFGGFLEMSSHNTLTILADAAVRAEDIDLAEVEKAKQRAEEIIKKTDVHEHDLLMAEVHAKQALIKIKAARLHSNQE